MRAKIVRRKEFGVKQIVGVTIYDGKRIVMHFERLDGNTWYNVAEGRYVTFDDVMAMVNECDKVTGL